jgi:hypothetical protein
MNAPTRGAQTTEGQIELFWNALTGVNTGGIQIDSYNLQWDAGSNGATWYDLVGEEGFFSTALTYTKVGGLNAGEPYMFRLKAFNVHGWGPYSIVSTIRAAT